MASSSSFYSQFLLTIDGWALRADSGIDEPHAVQSGAMAVYANTGLRAAIEALESNFISVANWLGGPWFWPIASAFAKANPPRDGRLFMYGDGFAEFLSSLEHEGLNHCASDLARVDWMYLRAHVAADHIPLTAERLAAVPADALFDLRIPVAPATQWRLAPDFPLIALWRNARTGRSEPETPAQHQGGVLVTRPEDAVAVNDMPISSVHLLDALAAGQTLGEAAAHAAEEEGSGSEHILREALVALLEQGALCLPPEMAN
ncbi:MAG: putative DNA-binding domain-containing protein [Pelomonas sp.]|nr:putative DNA-binding domain-containing protein [Roseateles sp.]